MKHIIINIGYNSSFKYTSLCFLKLTHFAIYYFSVRMKNVAKINALMLNTGKTSDRTTLAEIIPKNWAALYSNI